MLAPERTIKEQKKMISQYDRKEFFNIFNVKLNYFETCNIYRTMNEHFSIELSESLFRLGYMPGVKKISLSGQSWHEIWLMELD